jgi:hypothetical protein
MPKFCSPSPIMVTSPCKWKILEWGVKQSINKQIIILHIDIINKSIQWAEIYHHRLQIKLVQFLLWKFEVHIHQYTYKFNLTRGQIRCCPAHFPCLACYNVTSFRLHLFHCHPLVCSVRKYLSTDFSDIHYNLEKF